MDIRRPALRLAIAVMLAAAGCTPAETDGREGTGSIVFADGKDTSNGAQIKQLVDAWNQDPSNEYVKFVELSEATNDHRAQLMAHAQDSGAVTGSDSEDGCYDVVNLDIIRTAEFARWGYIVALDPDYFGAGDFLRQPIEGARYQGKLWAIPLRSDVGLLYYRKDVLDRERASYPRTWKELRGQAMTIAPKYELQGYVSQFDDYEGFTVNALESIWDAGGDVFGDDGGILIGSPAARTGVDRLVKGFQERWISPEATDFNEERSRSAFQDGKVLFLRNWTYVYQLLSDRNSPVADKFAVAPLPVRSALGGWNVALSHCSTRRKTAREFMRFLTSESSQRILFTQAGFAPSRTALYEDPVLQREYRYLPVMKESIENARNRPITPYYDQVSSAIQEHLHGVISASSTLNAELEPTLNAELERLARELATAAEGR